MKLQNNFTSVEQSKRLLEIGVPAWTADMYHWSRPVRDKRLWWSIEFQRYDEPKNFDATDVYGNHAYFPCWSVGRLIEIYNICVNSMPGMQLDLENEPESCTYIELIVSSFELAADDGLTCFSKLEDKQ